jgi:hypothetical protein
MRIHLGPIPLGSGERLLASAGDDLHGRAFVRSVAAPDVTHLKFARRALTGTPR